MMKNILSASIAAMITLSTVYVNEGELRPTLVDSQVSAVSEKEETVSDQKTRFQTAIDHIKAHKLAYGIPAALAFAGYLYLSGPGRYRNLNGDKFKYHEKSSRIYGFGQSINHWIVVDLGISGFLRFIRDIPVAVGLFEFAPKPSSDI